MRTDRENLEYAIILLRRSRPQLLSGELGYRARRVNTKEILDFLNSKSIARISDETNT